MKTMRTLAMMLVALAIVSCTGKWQKGDVINLHAGANYRLNSTVNLWLQANNLLNRRYDILYGMGAQRIGVMVGASFTF